MKKLITMWLLFMIIVTPYAGAESVRQNITVVATPPEGNYTALVNIASQSWAWLDDMKFSWSKYIDKYGVEGRIIDEGIAPSPLNISGEDVYALSYSYLSGKDIMSGASRAVFRLPLATLNYTKNITATVYEVQSNVMKIVDYNSEEVNINTPGRVLKFSGDIQSVNITYPGNITLSGNNTTLCFYYVYVRGPIEPDAYYIVHARVNGPAFLLAGWKNQTGYYGIGTHKYITNYTAAFTMMSLSGMCNNIFGIDLGAVDNATMYVVGKNINFKYIAQTKAYFNAYVPIYSDKNCTFKISVVLWFHENAANVEYPLVQEFNISLIKGIKTYHIRFIYYGYESGYFFKYELFFFKHNGVFLYGAEAPGKMLLYVNSTNTTEYYEPNIKRSHYFYHTSVLVFSNFSYTDITLVNVSIPGIQVPIVHYNYTHVYSIIDLMILAACPMCVAISAMVYYATGGQVDLGDLFYKYVWKPAYETAKWVINTIVRYFKHGIAIIAPYIRAFMDFVVNSSQMYGYLILQLLTLFFTVAAYALFLWPWIVLMRGLLALQEHGVDAMLDYFSSYVDRATSIMSKLLIRKGVG